MFNESYLPYREIQSNNLNSNCSVAVLTSFLCVSSFVMRCLILIVVYVLEMLFLLHNFLIEDNETVLICFCWGIKEGYCSLLLQFLQMFWNHLCKFFFYVFWIIFVYILAWFSGLGHFVFFNSVKSTCVFV